MNLIKRRKVRQDLSGGLTAGVTTLFQPIFVILLIIHIKEGSHAALCGNPGRPYRGSISLYPSTFYYSQGQRSNYLCNKGFTLLGDSVRICQEDGTWSGHIPICVMNMALGKTVDTSPTIRSYVETYINDGNKDTCTYMDMQTGIRFVRIDLGQNYMVDALVIQVPQGYTQEVSIYLAEKLQHSPGIQYRSCSHSVVDIKDQRVLVECKSDTGKTGILGQFIYIRDERKHPDYYFSICEVEVLTREDKYQCGSPDTPAFGEFSRVSDTQAAYICNPGFTLDGVKDSTCEGGSWTGIVPRCLAVQCEPLSEIQHGYVDIFPLRGLSNNSFNSVATYGCAAGYAIRGNSTRICQSDAKWSGSEPLCQQIDCGTPRRVVNAVHKMAANLTTVGASVEYSCLAGYIPQKILKNKPLMMSTTCLDSGFWKEMNFYCTLAITSSPNLDFRNANSSTTRGRSIAFDNNNNHNNDNTNNNSEVFQVFSEEKPEPTNSNAIAIIATALVAILIMVLIIIIGVALNVVRLEPLFELIRSGRKSGSTTDSQTFSADSGISKRTEVNDPIYCDIGSQGHLDYEAESEEKFYSDIQLIPEVTNTKENVTSGEEVVKLPVDIQQLYAQVDKSKKRKNKNLENLSSESRPLPPLPDSNKCASGDLETVDDLDSHIYMTLPIKSQLGEED